MAEKVWFGRMIRRSFLKLCLALPFIKHLVKEPTFEIPTNDKILHFHLLNGRLFYSGEREIWEICQKGNKFYPKFVSYYGQKIIYHHHTYKNPIDQAL